MSGDAIAAIKSIILIDERVPSLAGKVDKLADVRGLTQRLIRPETIAEIARADGTVLRIRAPNGRNNISWCHSISAYAGAPGLASL
jgi:hypothetical protein